MFIQKHAKTSDKTFRIQIAMQQRNSGIRELICIYNKKNEGALSANEDVDIHELMSIYICTSTS